MDLGIILAILMLAGWAVATFAFEGPGWIHGLLTVGVFVLIWRIVVRGTRDVDRQAGVKQRTDKQDRTTSPR